MAGAHEPLASRPPGSAAAGPFAAVTVAVGVVAIVAAVALLTRPPAPAPAAVRPDASSPATASELPTPPAPIAPATLTGAAPAVGSIAVVDAGGALSVIAPDGRSVLVSGPGERIVGFPAWSSDGRRLAAIVGREATTTIELFPIDPTGAAAGDGLPVYRSSLQQAFYVAWLPGDRALSFLANDADVVDLRVADTDRTSPLDETDRGSLVRKGAPLYFDWLDGDQALLHVGVGPGAFLARVGRDGHEIGADLPRPGAFRSAQVSADGASLAYVREAASGDGAGEIVVRPLLGGAERTLPVFGQAALGFAPSATVVALIGADAAGQADLGFPLGPLRTLDAATGATRTLLDGAVVGWFWSPDDRTIFAIRLQVPSGGTADAGAFAAGSPSPVPSEVHALFVDVATGAIRSDRVVRPGPRFVSEVLPYFDQYALSHRLWAPDSSSFLLPIVGADGTGTVIALPRDGSPSPFSIAATAAFWSP